MDPERYLTDRERLATALRDLRQDAGMTGVEAARRARMSQPKISKVENGRLLPSVADVQTLLTLYQAGAAERDALLEVAARLHVARRQARLGELEHEATTLRYFSPIVIPGLLQTAEYMRRVFSLDLSGAELARTVTARQARQQILYDSAKTFTFVITETALRWRFCPGDVMAAQAGHIASLATLANVEIGVIFMGAAVADIPLHGYQIFDDRLASVELEHAVVTVTDPRDIATYLRLFATMSQAAEFGQAARSRLAEIGSILDSSR